MSAYCTFLFNPSVQHTVYTRIFFLCVWQKKSNSILIVWKPMFTMKPNTVVLIIFKNYCLETDESLLWIYGTNILYTVYLFLYVQYITYFGTSLPATYYTHKNSKPHKNLRWIKLRKSDLRLLCFWFCFLNYLFPFPTSAPIKFTVLIIEEKNKLLWYMAPIIRDIRIALVI